MAKMAENCGGRSGSRSPDLLGVNDRPSCQIKQIAAAAKARFPNKTRFSSVSVPEVRTDRTKPDPAIVEAIDRAWGDFDPGPMGFTKPPANHLVYFVGGETGPVKIGFTQQPIKARLVCIQNGSPIKLHVLATLNCTRINERFYHERFAAHRLHGEWFERTPEIQAEIDRLSRNPPGEQ
jgi:hypothetical protein